jgi:hypothetical protein
MPHTPTPTINAQHRDSCLHRELYCTALYCQRIEDGVGQGVGVGEDRAVGGWLCFYVVFGGFVFLRKRINNLDCHVIPVEVDRTPEYSLRCSVPGPPKIGGLGRPCTVPITEFRPLERGSIVPSTTEFWVHKVMFDVIFHRNSGGQLSRKIFFTLMTDMAEGQEKI